MDKKEQKQLTKIYLEHTAIADIAINDLGLTLDEPMFFSPYCSCVEYGIDSEYGNTIRFETFTAMSYHLCTLKDCGIDLAIQLAKKSGLLNYKITDTEYLTEEIIEKSLQNQLQKTIILANYRNLEIELIIYYQNLFKSYCLERMTEEQLEERIKTKIKTY